MKKNLLVFALVLLGSASAHATAKYETMGPDGVASLTPPSATYVNTYSVAGGVAESITWPSGYSYMNISCPADYWIRNGGTAVVGASDVTDGTGSALNPAQRRRGSESSVSIISASAQVCSVEFWASTFP